MKRKIAEKGVRSEGTGLAVSVAAGTLVGATVGKVVKRTNRSAVTGAAVGAVAGGVAFRIRRRPTKDLAQIAGYVKQHLGYRTTAYLTGVDDAELVHCWTEGTALPEELPAQRLRSAFEATRHLVEAYDAQTARSWFMGMNPGFDDEAPARVLRHGRNPGAWEEVVLAAREFAEN